MLRLAKAFWDIALWRRSPAQLPASLFLLGLVAAAVAILEVVGALLPPSPSDHIVMRVLLSVGLPLLFAWAVLSITRHRQRFLQTGIALLGVAVLAQLVLYPLGSLLNVIGSDRPAAIPLGVLLFVGLIWYLLACANIWRAALDSGIGVGIAISVGYLLLSMVLEQQLLPDA
ncbi:MAG: hypothetical protein QOD56_310 [Gammaproteobacteria bacterium]|jgi:hypothetical protein|nr:hypothetical protein [Gammaproteobacteria bacterium]